MLQSGKSISYFGNVSWNRTQLSVLKSERFHFSLETSFAYSIGNVFIFLVM
jgi:hypothetical protein